IYELIWRRKLEHLLLVPYILITFLYHASMFVKFMRYFLPIYPFLILLAAYFILWLWRYANGVQEYQMSGLAFPSNQWRHVLSSFRPSRPVVLSIAAIVAGGTLIY